MSDNPFAADENPYHSPVETSFAQDYSDQTAELDRPAEMLRQTKPWVRFLSVMSFIFAGLLILLLFVFLARVPEGAPGHLVATAAITYVVMAFLYLVPAVLLWFYASRIQDFVIRRTVKRLTSALEAQKSFWRFAGIVTLVGLILLLLYILLTIFVVSNRF